MFSQLVKTIYSQFLSEPRDKVGSCADVSGVSMIVSSVYFQRPGDNFEINFSFSS